MAEPARKPPYSAVSIEPVEDACCNAVLEVAKQRFLVCDVPVLPLDACDRITQCQCIYKKWDDRRQEDRRTVVAGMGQQAFDGAEKRSLKRGRRSTD